MPGRLLKKIFGTKNDREIKRLSQLVTRINDFEPGLKALSDEDLKAKTASFRQMVERGAGLADILPEAFAVCREASVRVLGMRHFDVQIIGGLALNEGKIAEMKTGEGKTLTATAPLYANALMGKGAHLVTVNDYLARRDSEWMGRLYAWLGLSTGLIVHGLSDRERRDAYASDITYGTNNEFGFDYLRDNMKTELQSLVQREHFFAIVDEVDSILIDEARTPLIISGPTETNSELYYVVNSAIPGLQRDSDYIHDEKSNTVSLTEDGIAKIEKRLKINNLYDPQNIDYLHHAQQSLKAHVVFKKDVDYVVRDNKVIIVDEFTGRLMPGRRYSDGLHGALEAKEHLKVENENQTLATITFQNYFRMYKKLAGMTGTADTEAVEFKKIYNLDVVVIPTNRRLVRKDQDDAIYRTAKEKFNVIADEIAERQKNGQPVLVGTVSVEKSELLSSLLKKRNIPHEILNAKNHAREAEIIKHAGEVGHVTISTNMAGRGTDIVLGDGARERGGLCVIGTERHESRRIDNQLRGRSGRQGDPGASIFYLSLEDDLMRIFASDRLSSIMQRLGMKEGESIVSPMVTRAIERAQRRVEEQNFSSRKHLLEYDDVMNQQRQVIYSRRKELIQGRPNLDFFEDVLKDLAFFFAERHSPEKNNGAEWPFLQMSKEAVVEFQVHLDFSAFDASSTPEMIGDFIAEEAFNAYKLRFKEIDTQYFSAVQNFIYMQIIDSSWKDHLASMDQLKDSVSLRGYGQRDPLQEYKKEAFRLFEDLMNRIDDDTVKALIQMPPPQKSQPPPLHTPSPDLNKLEYVHKSAEELETNLPADNGQASGDGMIYQGSRERRESREVAQTFVREQPKVGRNDPCHCGSGKKFKKCHGRTLHGEP